MSRFAFFAVALLASAVFTVVSVSAILEISMACEQPVADYSFDGPSCSRETLWANCLVAAFSIFTVVGSLLSFRKVVHGSIFIGLAGMALLYTAEAVSLVLVGGLYEAGVPLVLGGGWTILFVLCSAIAKARP